MTNRWLTDDQTDDQPMTTDDQPMIKPWDQTDD